jgi:energy-coupling factor transporter ATP-binding protein EcfA2
MLLKKFRVQMFKSILDSGWVEVEPLTVVVGKNEAGKTTLLKALHKLNPKSKERYDIHREWPRGHRDMKNPKQVVCIAEFELTDVEARELETTLGQPLAGRTVRASRTYENELIAEIEPNHAPGALHPKGIAEALKAVPTLPASVGSGFAQAFREVTEHLRQRAADGTVKSLAAEKRDLVSKLTAALSTDATEAQNEQPVATAFEAAYDAIQQALVAVPPARKIVQQFVAGHLPRFIYMDDYRRFSGTAFLDEVKTARDESKLTPEQDTLLKILELSGLNLDAEVQKGGQRDREERQYDLDDAGASLTRRVSGRWKQRSYRIKFGADGPQFFTFVSDGLDGALIRLEERSKGFQWFFSFDMLFTYESDGDFEGCVLLLDEPGLHLHPAAQDDFLRRLEAYAEDNVLIYTTHLPFLIDLRHPERIRVISEGEKGSAITSDLTASQPEGKFVLQAALGMKADQSFLVAKRNLVVEGVDDYWILSEISNLLVRSGEQGLPDDVVITPAGGASEVAYLATFMIAQDLDVVVLLDSDGAGETARDKLVKSWLTRYKTNAGRVLMLGPAAGATAKEFAIEDLFPERFYVERVEQAYDRELRGAGVATPLALGAGEMLCKRVERALAAHSITFNKGRIATKLRGEIARAKALANVPAETVALGRALIATICAEFEQIEAGGAR